MTSPNLLTRNAGDPGPGADARKPSDDQIEKARDNAVYTTITHPAQF